MKSITTRIEWGAVEIEKKYCYYFKLKMANIKGNVRLFLLPEYTGEERGEEKRPTSCLIKSISVSDWNVAFLNMGAN